MNTFFKALTVFRFPFKKFMSRDCAIMFEVIIFSSHIADTAVVYRNEQHIGEALKSLLPKYNLKREDIFITSKLSKNIR